MGLPRTSRDLPEAWGHPARRPGPWAQKTTASSFDLHRPQLRHRLGNPRPAAQSHTEEQRHQPIIFQSLVPSTHSVGLQLRSLVDSRERRGSAALAAKRTREGGKERERERRRHVRCSFELFTVWTSDSPRRVLHRASLSHGCHCQSTGLLVARISGLMALLGVRWRVCGRDGSLGALGDLPTHPELFDRRNTQTVLDCSTWHEVDKSMESCPFSR